MLGFGHQTVFSLCLALVTLTAVSIICLALLYFERQDIDLLQQHISSLRQENIQLRTELDEYRSSHLAQQETAARPAE
jgi:Tfp pilus assembly protein PilN